MAAVHLRLTRAGLVSLRASGIQTRGARSTGSWPRDRARRPSSASSIPPAHLAPAPGTSPHSQAQRPTRRRRRQHGGARHHRRPASAVSTADGRAGSTAAPQLSRRRGLRWLLVRPPAPRPLRPGTMPRAHRALAAGGGRRCPSVPPRGLATRCRPAFCSRRAAKTRAARFATSATPRASALTTATCAARCPRCCARARPRAASAAPTRPLRQSLPRPPRGASGGQGGGVTRMTRRTRRLLYSGYGWRISARTPGWAARR